MPYLKRKEGPIYYEYDSFDNIRDIVVLIHGNGLDSSSWDLIIPYLSGTYNVLRYDLRGHGRSGGETRLSWDTYCGDLAFLLDSLNIRRSYFIGHGFGCDLTIQFAMRRPEAVAGMVLLSLSGLLPKYMVEKGLALRKSVAAHCSFGQMVEQMFQTFTILPLEHPMLRRLISVMRSFEPSRYFDLLDFIIEARSIDDLKKLGIPVLVLAGEYDSIYTPYLMGLIQVHVPDAAFRMISHASNLVYVDQPEETSRWVQHFFQRQGMQARAPGRGPVPDYCLERSMFRPDHGREIRINLLTCFRVYVNGEEVWEGWNQRFAKNIFVYLVFHRSVSREKLCEELWPDVSYVKARRNLRVYLSHLKSLIEPSGYEGVFLSVDMEYIHLKGNVFCDLIYFHQSLRQAYDEPDPKVKAALAKRVLWNAPDAVLSGWYDHWMIHMRECIEFQLYELAKWIAAYHYGQGEIIEYIEYSKCALVYYPNDMKIRQSVASVLLSMNRQEEAEELEREWRKWDDA
ncbi:alpha/beta hydrolase [Paenibacillus sp. DMB20]|uniref:alpha/beta hydrolase n=1 Tax=Paenibacillus sp. DMB20 TaxID=1642570 RepID=UPI0006277F83|nr:alpha/beta hydrolase [Paenibacillus sp. DMB20]KKO54833.1 hypothetical protein XI25_03745 [Paenibacillus sp. DMB20]